MMFLLLVFTLYPILFFNNEPNSLVLSKDLVANSHPLYSFEEELFFNGVNSVNKQNLWKSDIYGGIVPHHTIASPLISGFFYNLSKQEVKTIIVAGPNHDNEGDADAATSRIPWETPFGLLSVDEDLIAEMIFETGVELKDDIISDEQSIAALVAYFKYYLPETNIVPIILKSGFDISNVEKLSEYLSQKINKEIVLIVSVDFSHYLSFDVAQKKDEITLSLIKDNNINGIYGLNSDYLDSPPSISLLIRTMEKAGADNPEVLAHSNSALFLEKPISSTTSYFIITYR